MSLCLIFTCQRRDAFHRVLPVLGAMIELLPVICQYAGHGFSHPRSSTTKRRGLLEGEEGTGRPSQMTMPSGDILPRKSVGLRHPVNQGSHPPIHPFISIAAASTAARRRRAVAEAEAPRSINSGRRMSGNKKSVTSDMPERQRQWMAQVPIDSSGKRLILLPLFSGASSSSSSSKNKGRGEGIMDE